MLVISVVFLLVVLFISLRSLLSPSPEPEPSPSPSPPLKEKYNIKIVFQDDDFVKFLCSKNGIGEYYNDDIMVLTWSNEGYAVIGYNGTESYYYAAIKRVDVECYYDLTDTVT